MRCLNENLECGTHDIDAETMELWRQEPDYRLYRCMLCGEVEKELTLRIRVV